MNNEENKPLKIRFRLPNGEEFEAEGPQDFIETQRNYFLTLIGRAAIRPPLQQSNSPISPTLPTPPPPTEIYHWERLFTEEEHTLTLRPKTKLPPQDIALLVLAAARVLLNRPAYSALELAHSLKTCGVAGNRLDRLLAGEIQAGRILAQGAKRSRSYQLTDEGFARAFVLSEKLAQPI